MNTVQWENLKQFTVGGNSFEIINFGDDHDKQCGSFLVFKPRWMLTRYIQLFKNLQPELMIELGIYKGGSSIFFHSLASPRKLVAIDIASQRELRLDQYIGSLDGDSLKAYFGVNQANNNEIRFIAQAEFSDQFVDLVVDDASHFLEETVASFNTLFPRLRKGGVYVIEDWCSSGQTGKSSVGPFIHDLVHSCPRESGLIPKVEIYRSMALIWRGEEPVEDESFMSRIINHANTF